MFSKNFDKKDDEQLYAGPRIKTLATKHLEFILRACLNPSFKVNFIHNQSDSENKTIVKINNLSFKLNAILLAFPDFEHIRLTDEELSHHSPASPYRNNNFHPAEDYAIRCYADTSFRAFNDLFRTNVALKKEDFLGACMAAHGIANRAAKLSSSHVYKRFHPTSTFLGPEAGVAKMRGFYSTSKIKGGLPGFGSTLIMVCQPYFMAQDISTISRHSEEKEVLFLPGAEFQFKHSSRHGWMARPVRTVPPVSDDKRTGCYVNYAHGFTANELQQIENSIEHFQFAQDIDNLLSRLRQAKQEYKKSRSWFAGFFNRSDPALEIVNKVISDFDQLQITWKPLSSDILSKTLINIQLYIEKITKNPKTAGRISPAKERVRTVLIEALNMAEQISDFKNEQSESKALSQPKLSYF